MNAYINQLKSDKIMLYGFSLGLFLIFCSLMIILFVYSRLPPFIPIFNQMPWGEARLGKQIEIFLPLAFSLIIFLVNISFSSVLYLKTPLISRILCVTSLLVSLFMILLTVRTIQLAI